METAKGREITNKEMIQAKDLRIGNWVMFGGYTHQLRLSDFNKKMDKYLNNGSFLPIPLTPDILEKAGFHYNNNKSRVARLEIAYTSEDYPCTLQVSGSGIQICRSGIGAICAPVFYLHQLQNLFYSLTGTELTIEL